MAMRTLCSLPVLAALFLSTALHAETNGDNGGPVAKADPASVRGCRLSGVATPDLGVPIVDKNGQALARFGGVAVPVTLSDFPEQASGRFHVTTGAQGRIAIDGYVDAKSLPLYVTSDLPVIAGQVFIAKGARVEFVGRSGSDLRVRLAPRTPLADTFEATVPCEAVSLEAAKTEPSRVPGHSRAYYMKRSAVSLFDLPGAEAKAVTTLHLAPDARGALFFGDRRVGDSIHVLYRQDAKIEGWMSVKDLELLPKGELVDQKSAKPATNQASRLTVAADAKLYRAPSELALHGKADPKLPPIGTVPKDTELYVLDIVVGWANVLPKQLDVVPLAEGRFWVRASELGI
jgi:hypothetical protein